MMVSVIIREFQIDVYHTLLRVADSCAHLNDLPPVFVPLVKLETGAYCFYLM
jgi:hypothetical protein